SRSSAALAVAVLSFVCLVVVVADMSASANIHIAIAVPAGIVAPIMIPPIFTGIRLGKKLETLDAKLIVAPNATPTKTDLCGLRRRDAWNKTTISDTTNSVSTNQV